MTKTKEVWLDSFCKELGIDVPTEEEVQLLLLLAGSAAHGSERTAAPLACWVVGRSQIGLQRAVELAELQEKS